MMRIVCFNGSVHLPADAVVAFKLERKILKYSKLNAAIAGPKDTTGLQYLIHFISRYIEKIVQAVRVITN